MYPVPVLVEPELVRCEGDWIVNVPQGKVAEALSLARSENLKGFKLNSFTGATQETLDALLSAVDPGILVIAGQIEVRRLAPSLSRLVLGIGTPWPASLVRSNVRDFSCMESVAVELLPPRVERLEMFGFASKNLSPFRELPLLAELRLAEAKWLESLNGVPAGLAQLHIVACKKLFDISALQNSGIRSFSIELCPKVPKEEIKKMRALLDGLDVDAQ